MSQVNANVAAETPPRHTATQRLLTIVVAAIAAIGLVAGAVALTSSAGLWGGTSPAQPVAQDLDVIYRGERIDQGQLQALNDRGLALFTASDVDTATELHAMRAFDTMAELDAYSAAYAAWQTAGREGQAVQPWGTVAPQSWNPGD